MPISKTLGCPPKLIWVQIKNAPNRVIADALINQYASLVEFDRDPRRYIYELY